MTKFKRLFFGRPKEYSLRRILVVILVVVFSCISISSLLTTNVSATDSTTIVETSFFGNLQDDGKGCGVYTVLNLVVDILTIGAGILGVIGITVVGIQYLTAGGNEQQTAKAKRRMAEIIIGLIAYAVLYSVLQWLLPGGKFNTDITCQTVSDEQLAQMRADELAAKQAAAEKAAQEATSKGGSSSSSSTQIPNASTAAEQIAQTAELLAWPSGTPSNNYTLSGSGVGNVKKWSDLGKAKPTEAFMKAYDKVHKRKLFTAGNLGADCGVFVTTVLKYSGHDPAMRYGQAADYYGKQKKKWKQVTSGGAKRGDVCIGHPNGGFHTKIFLGKDRIAEAQNNVRTGGRSQFGVVKKGDCKSYDIWRPL